ncbi:MAG: DUF3301 domain-containing protein [Gammaproteobacteria bacterium]|nr:DUF3301 domain-containing protein [Gammaproteobacteria bacterium]
MESIFWLVLLGTIGGFWLINLRARELATRLAREHCAREQLQFLDDTVALAHLRPAVDRGRLLWRRRYQFEFSEHGELRRAGYIELLGLTVKELYLEPYRIAH